MIRELQPKVDLFVCTINWWTCIKATEFFDEPGDHAGEMEDEHHDVDRPRSAAAIIRSWLGKARKFRIAGLRDGWAWAPRHWA